MKIWTNTSALDEYNSGLYFTNKKEDAELILLGSRHIDINEFPNIKGIFRVGVGKENVPIKDSLKRDILIQFPSEKSISFLFEETANFTISLILRMMYPQINIETPWSKTNRVSLTNKNALVIGMGNIGSKVALKLKNLMSVMTFDIVNNNLNELDDFIKNSDVITLHIPNSPENDNFFDKDKFNIMKKGSILINTARANIVNENDLYQQLKNHRIKCAFDVFWEEPYAGKLKKFHPECFYMSPHIASSCIEFFSSCREDLDNMIKTLKEKS